MKISDMYRLAQVAVVKSDDVAPLVKLTVLRELMHKEDLEKFCEKEAEKEAVNGESV